VKCPKPPQRSFNLDQSHINDVRKSPIYRSNQKWSKNAITSQLNKPAISHQLAMKKIRNCMPTSKYQNNRHYNESKKLTEIDSRPSAITFDTTLSLINRIPAHKIIFDFPITVLLLLSAL
jgi:hypothetical protein